MHTAFPKEPSRAAVTLSRVAARPRRAVSAHPPTRGRAVMVARSAVRQPVDALTSDVLCRARAAERISLRVGGKDYI